MLYIADETEVWLWNKHTTKPLKEILMKEMKYEVKEIWKKFSYSSLNYYYSIISQKYAILWYLHFIKTFWLMIYPAWVSDMRMALIVSQTEYTSHWIAEMITNKKALMSPKALSMLSSAPFIFVSKFRNLDILSK